MIHKVVFIFFATFLVPFHVDGASPEKWFSVELAKKDELIIGSVKNNSDKTVAIYKNETDPCAKMLRVLQDRKECSRWINCYLGKAPSRDDFIPSKQLIVIEPHGIYHFSFPISGVFDIEGQTLKKGAFSVMYRSSFLFGIVNNHSTPVRFRDLTIAERFQSNILTFDTNAEQDAAANP